MQSSTKCISWIARRSNYRSAQKQTWNLVKPGRVSPIKSVPTHIAVPDYISPKSIFPKIRFPFTKEKFDIKTPEQIEEMLPACQLARKMLDYAGSLVIPGITTNHIDALCHQRIIEEGAYPSPLHYKGFPKSLCTSVNNVCCHGIPDDRPLESGDIVTIDVTVYYQGYHGDTARTFPVGNVGADATWLITVTKECLDRAIDCCGPGVPLSTIGEVITAHAQQHSYTVIERFCGHGIGTYFHGPPEIIHNENDDHRPMKEGMVFTIEPILTDGFTNKFRVLDDGWTAVTVDGSRSAQFEHTIAITKDGARILTDKPDDTW